MPSSRIVHRGARLREPGRSSGRRSSRPRQAPRRTGPLRRGRAPAHRTPGSAAQLTCGSVSPRAFPRLRPTPRSSSSGSSRRSATPVTRSNDPTTQHRGCDRQQLPYAGWSDRRNRGANCRRVDDGESATAPQQPGARVPPAWRPRESPAERLTIDERRAGTSPRRRLDHVATPSRPSNAPTRP